MDLRVAELLAARGLLGTFYIPVKGHHGCSRTGFAEMSHYPLFRNLKIQQKRAILSNWESRSVPPRAEKPPAN